MNHVERLLASIERNTNQCIYDILVSECGIIGSDAASIKQEKYIVSIFEKMQILCNAETISDIFNSYSFNTFGELKKVYGFNNFLGEYSDCTEIREFSWNENRFNFILGDELFVKVYSDKGSNYFLDGTFDKESGVYEYIQKNKIPIRVPKMIHCGDNNGYPYIALEYIDGRTVRKPLYKGNPEEERRIISSIAGELLTVLHLINKNDELCGVFERNHSDDIQVYSQRLRDVDGNAELMDASHEHIRSFLSK